MNHIARMTATRNREEAAMSAAVDGVLVFFTGLYNPGTSVS